MAQLTPRQIPGLLRSKAAFGSTLAVLLRDMCDTPEEAMECLQWHPDVWQHMFQSLYGVKLPEYNLSKLQAVALAVTTNFFYTRPFYFCIISNALSGQPMDWQTYEPPEIDEMAWAITEVAILNPPDNEDNWDEQILSYIGARLDEENFIETPQSLQMAVRNVQREDVSHEPAEGLDLATTDTVGGEHLLGQRVDQIKAVDDFVQDRFFELESQLKSLPLKRKNSKFSLIGMLESLNNGDTIN